MSWKKTRHDKYYALAKEQGFRSRAAFKLIQLNKKFDFLSKAKACLDLCAAPGGWLQVCSKYMPTKSLIIGVDLLPIRPIRGVVCLKEDITTQRCRAAIKREAQGWDFDIVIHDGAPNVGGSTWAKDAYSQAELVLHSLKLTTEFLRPRGTFVTKIFRSQDYNALLWVLKKFFRSVTVTKPASSRNASAEIFAVCQGFLAPKKIDPRLLDPSHVFKAVDTAEQQAVPDVFHDTKRKRQRGGYEDGVTLLYKELPAAEFIASSEPVTMLGMYNAFVFKDQASREIKEMYPKFTTEEVQLLCQDLKVLGKKDFSALLKWRLSVRKAQREAREAEDPDQGDASAPKKAPLTEEEQKAKAEAKMDAEIQRLAELAERRDKKAARKRRLLKLKNKQRIRSIAGMMDGSDAGLDANVFSLRNIRDSDLLDRLRRGAGTGGEPVDNTSSDEGVGEGDGSDSYGSDSDDEARRVRRMEADLDASFEEYRKRRGLPERRRGRSGGSRTALDSDEIVIGEDDFNLLAETRRRDGTQDRARAVVQDSSDDEGQDGNRPEGKRRGNPLLLKRFTSQTKQDAALAAQSRVSRWFSRDMFQDDAVTGDGDEQKAATEPSSKRQKRERRKIRAETESSKLDEMSDGGGDDSSDQDQGTTNVDANGANDDDGVGGFTLSGTTESFAPGVGGASGMGGGADEGDAFEEVALEDDWSSDSDARAEALAMGSMMIRKKSREKLINDGYNRYAFNDTDDAPDWFAVEEQKYNVRNIPVTKAQVAEARAQLMAVDARPIKKVAQAKYRKKVQAMKRMKKATQKADGLLNDDSIPDAEKIKGIEKLIKKGAVKFKKERVYVVSKRGPGGKEMTRNAIRSAKRGGSRVKLVDRRLRSDKNAEKRKARNGKTTSRPGKKGGRSLSRKRRRRG